MHPGASLGILGPVHWLCYGAPPRSPKSRSVGGSRWAPVTLFHYYTLVFMSKRVFYLIHTSDGSKNIVFKDRSNKIRKCKCLALFLLLCWATPFVLLDPSRAVRADWRTVNAGVLLLRIVLIHLLTLHYNHTQDQTQPLHPTHIYVHTYYTQTLTELLFFLLLPSAPSLMRRGAIFLGFGFFLSETRGLLLRFLKPGPDENQYIGNIKMKHYFV